MVLVATLSNGIDFFAVFVATLYDEVGFFAVFVRLATRVRVGMALVLVAVSIAVFFTREESDGRDVVTVLVAKVAVLLDGDELSAICFCSLFRVLQIFGSDGAFAVPTGCGLSFLRRCDCQRGVGGAVVTAVPFFFGGIVVDGVVQGGILGEWGNSGGNFGDWGGFCCACATSQVKMGDCSQAI